MITQLKLPRSHKVEILKSQEKVDLNLEICFLPLPQQTKEFWGEITATEKSRMYRMQSKQMAGNGKMGLAVEVHPRPLDVLT